VSIGAANVVSYVYNASSQRVRKSGTGIETYFVYDEAGHLLGEYGSGGALIQETVWMNDTPVATLRPHGSGVEIYYVHTDHLDTPRKVTPPDDNLQVWRWDSDAFGSTLPNENPEGAGTFRYKLRLPGQYYDGESGLHYNYRRDYDPMAGRYIESDPIGVMGGIDTYNYTSQNPISRSDPTGELWQAPLIFCARWPRLCGAALACLRNPKQCAQKSCALVGRLYQIVCGVAGCRVGESCPVTVSKTAAAVSCLSLRTAYTLCRYAGNGDWGHEQQITQVLMKVENCRRVVPINCSGCIPETGVP
jgi:RHS repeat-associated protein